MDKGLGFIRNIKLDWLDAAGRADVLVFAEADEARRWSGHG